MNLIGLIFRDFQIEDLCLFSYKHRKVQLVSKMNRLVRVRRGMQPELWREKHPHVVIIWTDEKWWDVDSTKNRQNDRFLSYCIREVPKKKCSTN